MSTAIASGRGAWSEHRFAPIVALRRRPGVGALLLAGAAGAWWSTSASMAGMDAGPGTSPGALGWFAGTWAVMMAAMMLPSLAPTAAQLAGGTRRRGVVRAGAFAAAYLAVWLLPGLAGYGLYTLGRDHLSHALSWHQAGRWAAGAILLAAAVYELTPVKRAFLARCRRPPRRLTGRGPAGALAAGAAHAVWCVGCCVGLMSALFALGVMSITWMAVLAALVALQKLLPWRGRAVALAALVLALLAAGILLAPHAVPGLVVPGSGHPSMSAMGQAPASGHPTAVGTTAPGMH